MKFLGRIRLMMCLALLCNAPAFAEQPMPAKSAEEVVAQLRGLARHGDWLVIRGVHPQDDLVAALTAAPWSHAGMYDRERGEVIEAEGKGVHASTLEEFVGKAARLMLIRPMWTSDSNAQAAVAAGRAHLGKKYDYSGLIGLGAADRFYCTELVTDVYRPFMTAQTSLPFVIPPGQLYYWGTIVFDSGPR